MDNTRGSCIFPVLYYVHDPMCSWCWGFQPVWQQVQQTLPSIVEVRYVLGGLAPDNEEAMPQDMQSAISDTWRHIQHEIPGTEFNFDFWTACQPRRSTYPACRAVIAAELQQARAGNTMLSAIQQAYYLQAKNPSDSDTLEELAADIGLDTGQFTDDINSERCKTALNQQLALTARLDVTGFPSLVLSLNDSNTMIYIDYNNSDAIVSSILSTLGESK